MNKSAFTLIELLVVITIIVILLALLTPALDKAIYQAELTVCSAQLRGIAQGATVYAAAARRHYPARATVITKGERRPFKIAEPSAAGDDRPVLQSFLNLKVLVDPFCEPVELGYEFTKNDTHVYCTYDLWFGFEYDNNAGMKKIGDRVRWRDPDPAVDNEVELDLLACDTLAIADGYMQSSHPDDRGVLYPWVSQDMIAGQYGAGLPVPHGFGQDLRFTGSLWLNGRVAGLGTMDRSFAHADGSAERLDDLAVDSGSTITWDQRLTRIRGRSQGTDEGLWLYVAK